LNTANSVNLFATSPTRKKKEKKDAVVGVFEKNYLLEENESTFTQSDQTQLCIDKELEEIEKRLDSHEEEMIEMLKQHHHTKQLLELERMKVAYLEGKIGFYL